MKKKKVSKYPWWYKFIFAAARKVWRWSPIRRQVLKLANGKCAKCLTVSDEVQVDHIAPILAGQAWPGWDIYFARLFDVTLEQLQVLCKPCHREKTRIERQK